jgi:hypothetical protein
VSILQNRRSGMIRKKNLLFAAAALMLGLSFVAAPNAKAQGKAPGEGLYAGAFLGFGTGILQAKVASIDNTGSAENKSDAATYETERGGLGLSGIQGGLWSGWGMKTADDLYVGAEISALSGDEQFKLTTSSGLRIDDGTGGANGTVANLTQIKVRRAWSAGGALRVGYYVNADTLFALKGGVAISGFEVDIGASSNTYYAGGPQVGGSVETRLSKIDPNLSLRMEFVYTDYLTADVFGKPGQGTRQGTRGGADAELTGHDSAGRVGIQYSF